MQIQIILAVLLAIPVILLPVVFFWYLQIAGLRAAVKDAREKATVNEEGTTVEVQVK
jgi:hypothetical protein